MACKRNYAKGISMCTNVIYRDNHITLYNSDCPRIELFARQKVEGWDIWGNELPNDISFNEALGV